MPFEFSAADSLSYHQIGINVIKYGYDNLVSTFAGIGLSDRGFPFHLSLIYYVFGDHIIIPRIVNAILGAWTVVLIYHLSRRNFGERTGKIAAIMMMLLPNLIYYCGLHLKETVMIFLLVAFIERADILLRKRIAVRDLILVTGLGASLFFFRSVLFVSVIFALFSLIMFIKRPGKNWMHRVVLGLWVVIIFWLTFSYRIQAEFNYLLENIDAQSKNLESRATKQDGNTLATYGSSLLFAPVMFVAPFPTFVNIELQQNQMLLSGAYFVKNVMAFFILISIIDIIRRRQIRKYILILSFLLAYLAILAQSPFALSERFHLPAIPFLIILAANGVVNINPKNIKFFNFYLVLIILAAVAWNAFKLMGRGVL